MEECRDPQFHKPQFPGPTGFPSVTLATTFSNSRQAEKYPAMNGKKIKNKENKENMQSYFESWKAIYQKQSDTICFALAGWARSYCNLWPVSENLSSVCSSNRDQSGNHCWNSSCITGRTPAETLIIPLSCPLRALEDIKCNSEASSTENKWHRDFATPRQSSLAQFLFF